jgi:hypothetical protein
MIYTSPQEATFDGGSSAGLVHVEVDRQEEEVSFVKRSLRKGWRSVSVLIAGVLLLLLAPGWLRRRSDYISGRPLNTAGWGVVGVVGIPVLVLLLAAVVVLTMVLLGLLKLSTLVALTLSAGILGEGSLLVGFWAGLALAAPVVVAAWLGKSVEGKIRKSGEGSRFLSFGLGWLLLTILGLIPFLGGVVKVLVVLLGLGAVVVWVLQPLMRGSS